MKLLAVALIGLTLILTGCEDDETNNIAKAQACLDKVNENDAAAVEACESHISGNDSQKANIIRCSIKFLSGGLTTTRIFDAYEKLDNATSDKEAVFISLLSLSSVTVANEAVASCNKTGIEGLEYIANLALIGTTFNSVGSGIDLSDPEGSVQAVLDDCTGSTPSAACDPSAIGSAVINLGGSYCDGADADQTVCSDLNQAISDGNGDPAAIGEALYALLDQ